MKVHRLPPRTHQTAKAQFHKEALSKLDGEDSRANSWKLLHLTFSEYPSFLTANRGNPFTPCFSYLPVSFQFTFVHFLLFFQSRISTMIMFNLLHPLNSSKGIILEQFQVHLKINVSCSHGQNGLRFSIKYNTLPVHLSLQISIGKYKELDIQYKFYIPPKPPPFTLLSRLTWRKYKDLHQ